MTAHTTKEPAPTALPHTRDQALADGFTIDDHCNPPVAYKGPRFNPTAWHCVPSNETENLLAMLSRCEMWFGAHPDGKEMQKACRDAITAAIRPAPARQPEPTQCGRCEFEESCGSLVAQCPTCKAADVKP